ncbi:methyltransferase domain-containing protein [Weissella confusa]|uniref:methyltransferase domain-containing protein n=1 Tax=Weissella confusa TaxID=1583 RepID=UPI0022FDFD62|nr:methyltransferase domain-containing protein [Weissella confusa]MDA5458000.1 rRNA large subunit methyltransferase A [Weissella confusa]
MKKIEKGIKFVSEHLDMFRCAVDGEPYDHVEGNTLVCAHNHRLDINKKGSLYFLNHAVNTEYDDAMLAARRRVLTAGLFDGIVDAVAAQLPADPQRIMDVGTGEGTPFARLLAKRGNIDTGIGFDISKAGVNLATQLDTDAFFAVADLANLPFNDNSFDSIVEFFSPSAYEEFKRVLAPEGTLVKVVPSSGYLHELREMLYPVDSPNHTYSNQKVVDRFMENYPNATQTEISYQWQIPADLYVDLLHMTPLHWGARPEAQAAAEATPLPAVTINVVVLTVKP